MKKLLGRFAGLDTGGLVFLMTIACVAFSGGVFAREFGVLANSKDIRRLPPKTVAEMMQRLGYESVALSCSADQLETSAKAYRDHGIEIGAVYVGLTVTPTAAAFNIPIESVWAALRQHGLLLVHVTKSKEPQATDERITEVLRGLADQAASAGVTVAIYPHVGDRLPTIESAVAVAKAVDRPNLGVCFTLCHYLKQHSPDGIRQALREARPLLKAVTINGSDTGDTQSMDWDRLIQPLGQGSFDLPGLMQFLEQDLSFAGPVYVQLYNIDTPAEELLQATLSAWRAMHERPAEAN
ncbi:MAG: sugar phosphate isomerase/epimerase family protein [Thermogutta sp.]